MIVHASRRSLLGGLAIPALAVAAAALSAGPALGGPTDAVYTSSNDAGENTVLVFDRAKDGTLSSAGAYSTGGLGTGGGLGSQGALVLDKDGRRLFVVNAGSDSISSFDVTPSGLVLKDVEPSLGDMPISVTVDRNVLYVLNAAGAGGIQGFSIGHDGDLAPIAGTGLPLSGAAMTGGAQVGFSPDGRTLVVTEKATSMIDTYEVGHHGAASGPLVYASAGMTPFGFDFSKHGVLLVSEAFGGMPGLSAASSYDVDRHGEIELNQGSAPTNQTAACWLVVDPKRDYCYTTNTGSGSVTGFSIDRHDGTLALLDADGVTADLGAGSGPIDAAFDKKGRYLYVLNGGSDEIAVLKFDKYDGSLTMVQTVSGLPAATVGLAAR